MSRKPRPKPETPDEFIRRYPAITANIVAHSTGYATPTTAARIGLDGLHDRENWCEWIYSCYNRNARRALEDSIKYRHMNKGYMADYKVAKRLIDNYIETGNEPLFASWF